MKQYRLHAQFYGRVQGVFFRATTQGYARELGLMGTVQNMSDGGVELFAEGDRAFLEELLERLDGAGGPGHIEKAEINWSDPTGQYDEFKIIH